jgi:hypothetical protein
MVLVDIQQQLVQVEVHVVASAQSVVVMAAGNAFITHADISLAATTRITK